MLIFLLIFINEGKFINAVKGLTIFIEEKDSEIFLISLLMTPQKNIRE